ncbi:AfsR/SARP family transcriptional regulator [Devosia aurantiaca]|uniref:Bacterial transcriptional activator domain-containing protein n=1 Tax=Devosia aurantiaca TaxID=2714858 RepID=A0A6M1SNZ3_9HYPH|nr:BTAD domain-containing putative transcriptional regulator [Devosia aurantiaca]NGP18394.1 hypothetical protein [Devosia aurantiaca]
MPRLSIGVLGSCRVVLDDRVVSGAPSSLFRLASFVALSGQKLAASRQRLGSVLWPDVDHSKAAANLRQALSRSRHFQDSHGFVFLESNFSAVFIDNHSQVAFDLLSLLELLASPSPQAAVDLCSVYTGELLADLPDSGSEFEEWLAQQREILRNRCADRLSAAISPNSALSEEARVICAQKAIELDACNEEAYCCLMTHAAMHGNRSRFEALYESCQRQLMRELGVRPSSNTQRVFADLVARFEAPPTLPIQINRSGDLGPVFATHPPKS